MQQSLINNVQIVIGDWNIIERMNELQSLHPFDDRIIDFFDELSKEVIKAGRLYSDVVTFGFWCRRSHLVSEKNKYNDITRRIGRGVTFHSTPSNVPVNFAFSFAAGLLAGNPNIVRLPGKDFQQVHIICDCIQKVLNNNPTLKEYIAFIKYAPKDEVNAYFSSICNSRIVWGGDETIRSMRVAPLRPRAIEINFADRYSVAVFNSEAVVKENDLTRLIKDFYNDTFFSDQNACTSPRIVFWYGSKIGEAKKVFWNKVLELEQKDYGFAESQSTGKLHAMYKVAANKKVKLTRYGGQWLYCLQLNEYDPEIMNYRYNSGFFYEYDLKDISELKPFCENRCQTLSYYGFNKDFFEEFISKNSIQGIDRIVPVGKTMDFSLIWDGYDLIRCLSRVIDII